MLCCAVLCCAVLICSSLPQDMSKARDGEVVPPLKPLRELVKGAKDDRDGLIPLIAEAAAQSQPVLVFCATRAQCQSCAKLAAEMLPAQLGPDFEASLWT